jgi:hypothetical protein
MNFGGLIFLLIAHYFCGRGVLSLFRLPLSQLTAVCFSFIIGIPLLSFVPCILQLLAIRLDVTSITIGIGIFTLLATIPLLVRFRRPRFGPLVLPEIYEWPFIVVIAFLMLVSIWRCFYYPPTSRDMLSGPELLAEFAVKEKTMINSVFSIDLQTTNNYFKSPYITTLQIIYKLLVSPFGQLWLSVLAVPFVAWLYCLLRSYIHPIIVGIILLFFITMPDMYAYTYLILYDYSNMVFFFIGFYFLMLYFLSSHNRNMVFSALMFGLATYIRTETVVLVALFMPLLAFKYYKQHLALGKAIGRLALFIGLPSAFYFLCIQVFVRNFVPIHFDLGSQVNPHLSNISPFFSRLSDMTSQLIFGELTVPLYGYFIYLFIVVLVIDIILLRPFKREAMIALYGIAVVYFGLAFLGYLLPLVDLLNTTKRGLFKMMPIMLLYMANSNSLLWISDRIKTLGVFTADEAKRPTKSAVKSKPVAVRAPEPATRGRKK